MVDNAEYFDDAIDKVIEEQRSKGKPAQADEDRPINTADVAKIVAEMLSKQGAAHSIGAKLSPYETDKKALIDNEETIVRAAQTARTSSIWVFGASQLVTKTGDRLNGVILLRTVSDKPAMTVYEVWGFIDPPQNTKYGLMASFSTDVVSCIINLRSGLDVEA